MPYVLNHGTWPHGDTWLHEVVLESYIPILNMINELHEKGLKARIMISCSPILSEQLLHPHFSDSLVSYANRQIQQAEHDLEKFIKIEDARWNISMGNFWKAWYQHRLRDFREVYFESIPNALAKARDHQLIELMPTSLTHAYLPLLHQGQSIHMQINTAMIHQERIFGHRPACIWLPECGYRPAMDDMNSASNQGLEEYLIKNGIQATIIDQSTKVNYVDDGISLKIPERLRPLRSMHIQSSIHTEQSLAIFIRHKELCSRIWSEQQGYPAHPEYLDFHKKEYDSSLRYWKVTDVKTGPENKEPYSPHIGKKQAKQHAFEFVEALEEHAKAYHEMNDDAGVICLAFDTELFGHWWFEGPYFLQSMIEYVADSTLLEMATISECMGQQGNLDKVTCESGSWGVNGTDQTWKNNATDILWDHIHEAEQTLHTILQKGIKPSPDKYRILNQALRELMLMQASDWPWLITRNTASDYAEHRFAEHHLFFEALIAIYVQMGEREQCTWDEYHKLENIENKDDILRHITIQDWLTYSE